MYFRTMLVGLRTLAEALPLNPLIKFATSWIRIIGKTVKKPGRQKGVHEFEDFSLQFLVRQ